MVFFLERFAVSQILLNYEPKSGFVYGRRGAPIANPLGQVQHLIRSLCCVVQHNTVFLQCLFCPRVSVMYL